MLKVLQRVADSSSNNMENQEYMAIQIENEHDYYDSIAKEWIEAISGLELIKSTARQRKIEKVPPLLLRSENINKKDYYEPVVVSLGPYHHEMKELEEGEKYKLTTLKLYIASTNKSVEYFSDKIYEVVSFARNCYLEGSTDKYNDDEFTRMMLLDGCFVLHFIESLAYRQKNMMLNNENLGALGFASITRDLFLLENQLPFIVLKVLMSLKFDDGGEAMLCTFFNYINFGELYLRKEHVIPNNDEGQPLHLLEIYRSSFLSITAPDSDSGPDSGSSSGTISRPLRNVIWDKMKMNYDRHDELNYMKKNRSFPSATELKTKGVLFRPTKNDSSTDIKFKSSCWYGVLELPTRVFSSSSKAILLNLIAYEMCPRNPNDFRVATYIKFMKSLIVHPDDVKELRSKRILIHSLRGDGEVARMFEEIETPAVNVFMFNELKRRIEKHCNSLTRTWLAELISLYFSSPWRTVALLGASSLLMLSFIQTYFTIFQPPDDSLDKIISILQNSTLIRHQN